MKNERLDAIKYLENKYKSKHYRFETDDISPDIIAFFDDKTIRIRYEDFMDLRWDKIARLLRY